MSFVGVFIIISIPSLGFVLTNFIAYLKRGKVLTAKPLWNVIQIITVIVSPLFFMILADFGQVNDCCTESAIFSPKHRVGIYSILLLSVISYVIGMYRKTIMPPIAEVFHNLFLVLGVLVNGVISIHLFPVEVSFAWLIFGNLPILLLYLIMLAENQRLLKNYITKNEYTANTLLGKCGLYIIKLKPIYKYSVLVVLLVPVLILMSLFFILFGQKPDSMVRAFTDTYKHGFSQLDHMCDNVYCGGHFLCSVGANGHKQVVKPIRYGERNGEKIICNRQLLVSNAFEELVQDNFPKIHKVIRRNYNRVGDGIHKHYHIFNIKLVSDVVYVLMKPLELIFLLVLYTFDKNPENRIASQYLNKADREKIKQVLRQVI